MNTPDLSLFKSVRSKSDFEAIDFLKASIASFWSSETISDTKACSGDKTKYVTPYNVSARVVKTSTSASESFTLKFTEAPIERPIQLRCCSLMASGQSTSSKSSNKRSA